MSLRALKWLTILLPPFVIGTFEYVRHGFLLDYLSMETGNLYITLLTLLLSYAFATWMFRKIDGINRQLAEEQARRAVYVERERLARELHDNIAQIVFFLGVHLKQGRLEEARSAVAEIDSHLRQAIFNLRTLPEDGISLADRLDRWLKEWSSLSGIEVEKRIEIADGAFAPAEEIQLFGLIQEAFTNIRKHSQANVAVIELKAGGGGWSLKVADDGTGFAEPAERRQTYGLSMMEKRAQELGATFTLRHPEQGGTEIRISRTSDAALSEE
jgi:two-component system nitrate/nitrite sensor histidine kinase NarX